MSTLRLTTFHRVMWYSILFSKLYVNQNNCQACFDIDKTMLLYITLYITYNINHYNYLYTNCLNQFILVECCHPIQEFSTYNLKVMTL